MALTMIAAGSAAEESKTTTNANALISTMVVYNSDNLPSLKELQQEIYDNNFAYRLPKEMNLASKEITLIEGIFMEKIRTKFQYVTENLKEVDLEDYNSISMFASDSTVGANISVLIVSSALVKLTNGYMSWDDSGMMNAKDSTAYASSLIDILLKDIKK